MKDKCQINFILSFLKASFLENGLFYRILNKKNKKRSSSSLGIKRDNSLVM